MFKIRRFFTIASFVLAGLISATNSRAVDFGPATTYPVGTNPIDAVVGDFNGDGKPDIAVLNAGSNTVSILLNNGDGTFQPAKNFDVGNSMNSIFIGDFNGDGKLDLALFLSGNPAVAGNGEVRILLSNGDGTFQAPVVTTLTVASAALKVGDFNGDKKEDLMLVNTDPAASAITLNFLAGKGDGTFQAAQEIPAPGFDGIALAVADFNQDGKLDLALSMGGSVHILLGQGNGTFQSGVTASVENGFSLDRIQTPDLIGDGKTDLFVDSNAVVDVPCPINPFHHGPCQATIHHQERFLGQGDGTFATGVVDTGLGPVAAFADFNGDSKLDAFVSASGISLGRGDGTFTPSVFSSSVAVTAAIDLNNDKLADLVSLDAANNNIVVLLNGSPSSGADLALHRVNASSELVGLGQQLGYSADVVNEGPQGATGVTFSDTLPSSVNFVSATASQGTCVQSNLVITCNGGALASGTDWVISIVVVPTALGTIMNSMDVTANETDLVPANNSASQSSTVVPLYTLTVTKTGNGSGGIVNAGLPVGKIINCGATCSAQLLSGRTINLIATAETGDYFVSWGGACSGTQRNCLLTMDGDKTVSADFVQGATLNVALSGTGSGTVVSSDGAIDCGTANGTCSETVAPGTQVSFQAAPSANSTFGRWSGACTGTDPNNCSVTANSAESVTATFNIRPDFSVDSGTSNLTVKSGGQVSEALTFPAQGGFSGPIALTCVVSGSAPLPTCAISPNPVAPGSSATLTINTAGLSAALEPQSPRQISHLYEASVSLGGFGLLLVAGLDKKRRGSWLLCLAILVATLVPAACGSSGGLVTPTAQNYTVTVTATAGQIQHSTTIRVSVN
jgi:uncharacterized repeat protein (TIGR01451 family)